MDRQAEFPSLKTVEDTVVSAGARLWKEAYEERYVIGGIALGVASAAVGKGLLLRGIARLAEDFRPAAAAVRDITEAGLSRETELSFSHLRGQMEKLGMSSRDLERAITPENFLGHGVNHEAYSIPNLPDYVLRKRNIYTPFIVKPLKPVANIFPEGNIGQAVADAGAFQVVKRQPGNPLIRWTNRFSRPTIQEVAEQTRKLSDVPQESYNELARTVERLARHKLHFDSIGDNVFFDSATKKFGLIDTEPAHQYKYIQYTNNRSSIVRALLPTEAKAAQPYYDQVLAKIGIAAKIVGLPD